MAWVPHSANATTTPGELWLECRDAIDAGHVQSALVTVRRATSSAAPTHRVVRAAVEAAAMCDEARWNDTLDIAIRHGLPVFAVDALEGLAVAASKAARWSESLRLFACADRLREETGYRWRFSFEQQAVQTALAAAREAIGTRADTAAAEGHRLDWRRATNQTQWSPSPSR